MILVNCLSFYLLIFLNNHNFGGNKRMIDKATIDKIMDAANIVDVVSDFVSLRKAGVNYKGLCPFHDEKTPSFVVSPAKGYCHCFSCGKGGNPVGFIMEHEQMTYPEALRWLANKYHIEIEEKELTDDERREQSARESLFILNEWALKYFQNNLYNTDEGKAIGMQYFRSRGFRDDTMSKFRLGYALQQRDALAKQALSEGFKEQFLIDTGLCYRKDNGQLQDRYAGRVIFPVNTVQFYHIPVKRIMIRILQHEPVLFLLFIPFAELTEFIAHEIQFFAGMGIHIGIQQTALGKLLAVIAPHLLHDCRLSMNHFIMGE